MSYTVFISHSDKDSQMANVIASQFRSYGATPIIGSQFRPATVSQTLPDKIKELTQQSHCVLAILTRNGLNSTFVQQEVGFALGTSKPVIPFVEIGIHAEELALLQGREYVSIDWSNLKSSFSKLHNWVYHLKKSKEEPDRLLLIGCIAILALIIIWGITSKK